MASAIKAPYTIEEIINQIGKGIYGGFCYIGASNIVFNHPKHSYDYECRPSYPSNYDEENNGINYEVGIQFTVNGPKGGGWKMVVAYEWDDTYTVYLWSKKGMIGYRRHVTCDALKGTVEMMYDWAMQEKAPKKFKRINSLVGVFG